MTEQQLPLPMATESIKLDIEDLTLGEIDILTSEDSSVPFREKLAILKRICIEGDVTKVRVKDLPHLSDMIEKQMQVMGNPTETA